MANYKWLELYLRVERVIIEWECFMCTFYIEDGFIERDICFSFDIMIGLIQ